MSITIDVQQRLHIHRGSRTGCRARGNLVATTVLPELERVLRGYYEFRRAEISAVFEHLLALPHVTVQDPSATKRASGVFIGL